jgi:hypothetical protein
MNQFTLSLAEPAQKNYNMRHLGTETDRDVYRCVLESTTAQRSPGGERRQREKRENYAKNGEPTKDKGTLKPKDF